MGRAKAGGDRPSESARYWRPEWAPQVDLLQARFVHKRFVRHTHETFVIAAITDGVEAFRHGGAEHRAGPGGLALINPDTVHTGYAGVAEGWRYSVLYPEVDFVERVAAETVGLRGTPRFAAPVVHDPAAARLIRRLHRAADEGEPLTADTLLRVAVAVVLRRHGGPMPERTVATSGVRCAEQARALLQARMVDPPTLGELASELGTGSFALLRAFRARFGLPPHAWLTDARVRRARTLLDAGVGPAEAATLVGFTDQAHLSRHFARIVGVPPGAYARGRGVTARTYKTLAPKAP